MTDLTKVNLDAPTDDPSQARAELEAAIDRLNDFDSTATDDGTKGFNLINFPPLSGESGVTNYQFTYGDVRRYGGVGDAVTDDTTSLNNAATYANSKSGRSIFLPKGFEFLYDATSASISITANFSGISGGGKITASDTTNHLISITGNDCYVSDSQFEGDGTFSANKSVANDSRIALIKVTGDNCNVISNILTDAKQNFIHYDGVTGGSIKGNKIYGGITTYNVNTDTAYQGIRVRDSSHINIIGNEIIDVGSGKVAEGIYCSAGTTTVSNNINITDNIVHDSWDHGIYYNISFDGVIKGNITISDTAGIVSASLFDKTNVTEYDGIITSDNIIIASATRTGTVGLYLRDANNQVCTGNIVSGFPRSIQMAPVTYVASGDSLSVSHNIISYNVLLGFTDTGILIGGGGALDLVEVFNNRIIGNTLHGDNNTSGVGISVSLATGIVKSLTIQGNSIRDAGNFGIALTLVSESTIKDNYLHNPCVSGATSKTGIYLKTCTLMKVSGNDILDMLGTPVMLYGIDGQNDTDTSVIENNRIKNAQTVPIRQMQYSGHKNDFSRNKTGDDPLSGSVTLANAVTTTVTNDNINATFGYDSVVKLTPTNQAAATLISGANSPFVGSGDHTDGASFKTRSAGSPVGTEIFFYEIIQ